MEKHSIEGKLVIVEAMRNSVHGNPRYKVMIGDRTFATPPNAMFAYGLTNHRDKQVRATVGMLRGTATVFHIEDI